MSRISLYPDISDIPQNTTETVFFCDFLSLSLAPSRCVHGREVRRLWRQDTDPILAKVQLKNFLLEIRIQALKNLNSTLKINHQTLTHEWQTEHWKKHVLLKQVQKLIWEMGVSPAQPCFFWWNAKWIIVDRSLDRNITQSMRKKNRQKQQKTKNEIYTSEVQSETFTVHNTRIGRARVTECHDSPQSPPCPTKNLHPGEQVETKWQEHWLLWMQYQSQESPEWQGWTQA